MAPPPTPLTTYVPSWQTYRRPGQRRNFYHEGFRHVHRFPIGSCVYMHSSQMSVPVGPMFVVEHCQALYPQGPPQYILQPTVTDNSKWLQANERHLFEASTRDVEGQSNRTTGR